MDFQIDRLRKEGSQLLEQEQERLKEEIREGQKRLEPEEEKDDNNSIPNTPKLKVSSNEDNSKVFLMHRK